jgi:spore coat polysaccharide biosynthesis protein SpsF (cytidylyltransferase family)
MKIKTAIEVQIFGDFDMKYTECIMVSPEYFNKQDLINEFCELEGITSIKGVAWNKLNHYTQAFIKFLELKGLVKLKTDEVYFTD